MVMTSMSSLLMTAASDRSGLMPAHLLGAGALIVLGLGLVGLFIAVVASILGSSLSTGMKLLWLLFVFCMPVLAWFAWYLLGRPDARRDGTPVIM